MWGLLPLKAIQKRRRGKQRQSPSLQPNQEESSQPEGVSRSKDSHLQTELGSTSCNESFGDLEDNFPLSSSSNGETQESGGKWRSYDSLGRNPSNLCQPEGEKKIDHFIRASMSKAEGAEIKQTQTT
jgi:hypothetical protein